MISSDEVQIRLDEILNRSERLESPMSFRNLLDLSSVLKTTTILMQNTRQPLDIEKGKQLLGQLKVEDKTFKVPTPHILNRLKNKLTFQHEQLSFSNLCSKSYKDSIISSLNTTRDKDDRICENFLYQQLSKRLAEDEAKLHSTICRIDKPPSIPQWDVGGGDEQYQLSPIALFYYTSFFYSKIEDQGTFSIVSFKKLQELILDPINSELFSHEIKMTLSDTFFLIHSIQKKKSALRGSLYYLSHKMRAIIRDQVNRNIAYSDRSPEIAFIPSIKAFLNLLSKNSPSNFVFSEWAVLYYAIICNAQKEIFRFLKENANVFDDPISDALEKYFRRLPLTQAFKKHFEEYHARLTTMKKLDPYKSAVLAILARNHVVPETSILHTIEEWLWLRMQFISDIITPNTDYGDPHDVNEYKNEFETTTIAEELENYDFKDESNPFLRGQIYLLTGQFEKAAKWFLLCDENIDDCLHVVLAMHIAHLPVKSTLIFPYLFEYAKSLYRANPLASVEYLNVLNDPKVRITAMAKLVVEIPDGDTIFQAGKDGARSIISQVLLKEDQEVINMAARIAEERDMYQKAANIYKLNSEPNYIKVIDIESIVLRQYIQGIYLDNHEVIGPPSLIAKEMREIVDKNSSIELQSKYNSFIILLHFANANLLYSCGKFEKAANEISIADFLPANVDQVSFYSEKILNNNELQVVLPDIFLLTMKIYSNLYTKALETQKRQGYKELSDAILELTNNMDIPDSVQKEILDLSTLFI